MPIPKSAEPYPTVPTYAVTKDGRIFNRATGGELTPTDPSLAPAGPDKRHSPQVRLSHGGGLSKSYYVHHIVLETFVGPRPTSQHVAAHKDGNELDNRLVNLGWMTYATMVALRAKCGRTAKGSSHGRAKLTEAQVVKIKRRLIDGDSDAAVGDALGIPRRWINHIRHGNNWADVKVDGKQWPPQAVIDTALAKRVERISSERKKRQARAAVRPPRLRL